MKLLAIYIKEYANIFQNVCLQFSNGNEVVYKDDKLSITIKEDAFEGFYGEIFEEVSAIIGKNGVGKSSLLNLIGYSFHERAMNLEINAGKMRDNYFLIYETEEEKIYCIEQIGDFTFENVEGYKTLIQNEQRSKFHCFYIEKAGQGYKTVKYENKLREKILYLSDQKQIDKTDLNYTIHDNERIMIPRVRQMITSLKEWYIAYTNLFEAGIIESRQIKIVLQIISSQKDSKEFLLQPEQEDTRDKIDYRVHALRENFNDLLSHHLTIITKKFLNVIDDYMETDFVEEYNQSIPKWSEQKIIEYFGELNLEFDKLKEKRTNTENIGYYKEIINMCKNFFVNLYRVKDYVVPGIDSFILELNGAETRSELIKFCEAYDKLQLHLKKMQPNKLVREDRQYYDIETQPDERLEFPELYSEINPLASSGEIKMISILGNLSHEIKEYLDVQPMYVTKKKKTYIILVDEIEKEMHIEWSRNLMKYLIDYFDKYEYKINDIPHRLKELNIRIQLIFSTHSPFMLSDLHSRSVIKLEKEQGMVKASYGEKVFAQNIQRIINQEFFMKGCFGAYAEQKINEVLEWLRGCDVYAQEKVEIYNRVIEEIGEPIVQNKLRKMYEKKMKECTKEEKLYNCIRTLYSDIDIDMEAVNDFIKRQRKEE